MQRVIEIHVKLNKEDKGEGGGAGLVVSGVAPHSGHYVMSFSKTNLLPKSAGNTQEAVAPSQHVATDLLAFAIDFWMLPMYIPEHFGIFSEV